MKTTNQKLQIMTAITRLLYGSECTYKETIEMLSALLSHMKQMQTNIEYETVDDYYQNKKCCDASNMIITPFNYDE